jgi:hypothetical protein
MKRITILALVTILLVLGVVVMRTARAQRNDENDASREQWEYLMVSEPQRTNLTASGNTGMRKESNSGFVREDYVTESQMDKLGAKGWELVSVTPAPTGAVYIFKRHK